MRTTLLLLFLSTLLACESDPMAGQHFSLIIRHAQVVDVRAGEIADNQRIYIRDSMIYALAPERRTLAATADRVIDAQGDYVLPGLWDMHVHMCWQTGLDSLFGQAFLQYGITGVRDMGGDLLLTRHYEQRSAADPGYGPTLLGCGPILDGDPPVQPGFSLVLRPDEDPGPLLDSLRKGGSDFFKVYSLLPEASVRAVAKYANDHGMTFAGHISEYLEAATAVELGQRSLEHLNRLEGLDSTAWTALIAAMRTHDTYLCPTTVIYQKKAHMGHASQLLRPADSRFIPSVLAEEWAGSQERWLERYPQPADREALAEIFQSQQTLIHDFFRAGIPLLAGSDFAGMPFVYPGYGLHEELALLVESGLSPAEALRTATLHPARFWGLEASQGSIAAGK
ncbi:MAG: amidohydrolase family protein, partial [Lewinella sp.]|nr:amidohydrolase family protein [Lewinella sp.]